MKTFVIRHPSGGFYSEVRKVGEEPVKRRDGTVLAIDDVFGPVFDARHAQHGSQFATEKDASDMMMNAEFGGPESFAGCVVVPSE